MNPKPSKLEYTWIKAYFHRFPGSIDKNKVYDANGRIRDASNTNYLGISAWFESNWYTALVLPEWCICCGFITILNMLVDIPALLLFPWSFCIVASFASMGCTPFWYFNVGSSIYCLSVMLYTLFGVYKIQEYYKGYYPGTRSVQVDVIGLTLYYQWNRFVFLVFALIYLGLASTGIYIMVTQCSNCQPNCSFTSIVTFIWTIVHFIATMNVLLIAKRFFFKFAVLAKPPVYEDLVELSVPDYTVTNEPVPQYMP
jgi:hypothetical protein